MTKKPAPKLDPKGVPGAKKVQLHLVPPSAIQAAARAFEQGAVKYGPYNWRTSDAVNVSTYVSAALRHIQAFQDGENMVPDNPGAHHLGAAIASMAVILDSLAAGTLKDDRPKPLVQISNAAEWAKSVQDMMATGVSVTRIDPSNFFKKPKRKR